MIAFPHCGFSFDIMQHVTGLAVPSYFNYSPRCLLDVGKVSLLCPAYLWLHLRFRTSGRGRVERDRKEKEKEELNRILKTFLKTVQ